MSGFDSLSEDYSETIFDRSAFLSRCSAFVGLPADLLELFEPHLEEQRFLPGEHLIREGDQGTSLMVLTEGDAQVQSNDVTGTRRVITQVTRNDVIGEMALLTGEPRSADVVALNPVRALVLPAAAFHQLASRNARLSIVLTRLVANRLGAVEHDALAGKEFGGYLIRRRLGLGGMSVVYEAVDPRVDRRVALKMMSHRHVHDKRARQFFEQEATIIQSFDCSDIVKMYDRFEAFKSYFLVMEFLDGQTLRSVLKSHGSFPESEVRKILGTIGCAIDYAHGKDVIHRDVKPSNIMLNQDGTTKLMDFGLASPAAERDVLTSTAVIGTPGYMSPEQAAGQPVTKTSDYFGLGCVGYEMLTGQRLIEARSPEALTRCYTKWERPNIDLLCRDASDEMRQLVKSCLSKDPQDRRIDIDQLAMWRSEVDTAPIRILQGDLGSKSLAVNDTVHNGPTDESSWTPSARSEPGSVTQWITDIRDGESFAATEMWNRYYQRLVHLARKKLRNAPRRVADEEDVALNTFEGFCRSAEAGRFPKLDDRDDLWQVLVMLTARKAANQMKYYSRKKRGGGLVRGESIFATFDSDEERRAIDEVAGTDPTPEFSSRIAIQLAEMLDQLGDEQLKTIAISKMKGYTNEELAGQMSVTTRTVERKLERIREHWAHLRQ
jgi:RNA polymerase sigma factor (sigma-70 family)